jgi:hypothetical protein
MNKKCTKCQEEKNISLFNKNKNTKDGLNYWCTPCKLQYQKENRTKEKANRNAKAWRQNNPDKVKETLKKYRESARGKVIRCSLQNQRKLLQKQRVPAWSNKEEITMWYEVAEVLSRSGVKFHVDHVVPLQGKNVCGLHVSENMQVLPAHLNISKNNQWDWEAQSHE